MKRISLMLIAVILAAVLVLNGCGGGGSSPSATFDKVIKAAQKGDMKTFSKHIIGGDEFYSEFQKASKEEREMASGMMKMMMGGIAESKYKIVGEEIDGDRAKVKIEMEGLTGVPQTFNFSKVDGMWKLDMNGY